MPPTFIPPSLQGDIAGDMSRSILQGGQARAQGHLDRGQALGGLVQGLGQVAGQAVQQRAEQQALSKRDAAVNAALQSWDGKDPKALYASLRGLDAVARLKVTEAMVNLNKLGQGDEEQQLKTWQTGVVGVAALPFGVAKENWETIKQTLGPGAAKYLGLTELPPVLDEETFKGLRQMSLPWGGKAPQREKVTTRDATGAETTRFVDPEAGETYTSAPKPPDPPAVGSFEDFVVSKFGARPTPEQVIAARKEYQQADDRPINIHTGEQRPLTQTAEAGLITRLATQYDRAATPAKELRRQASVIHSGLEQARAGNMNAGQQAVLVAFQKMLDPESVVREGEFARSAEGQALLARAQGAYTKLTQGGSGFTVNSLEQFAKVADDLAQGYDRYLAGTRARVEKNAARYNIPSELVITDYGFTPAAPAAQDPAADARRKKWGY